MEKLTEEEFWDGMWVDRDAIQKTGWKQKIKLAAKKILGTKITELLKPYDDYLLWKTLEKFIPFNKDFKAIEIGSAPGYFLLNFHKKFGAIPYGVEYADSGALINQRVFANNGLDPEQIIHSDFFAKEFQNKYKSFFDIVISRGFIEHFDHPQNVINDHLNLLKPGGYLIITIPNFSGFNRTMIKFLHKELIPMHNLSIMDKDVFCELFNISGLTKLCCNYFGIFSFLLYSARHKTPQYAIVKIGYEIQKILNIIFKLFFSSKDLESAKFSPFLIFIGRKSAS